MSRRVDDIVGLFRGNAGTFRHGHNIVLTQNFPIHLLQILVKPGMRSIISRPFSVLFLDRIFSKLGKAHVFGNKRDRIHPESIHALIKPKSNHVIDLLSHLCIFPIEIRLLD